MQESPKTLKEQELNKEQVTQTEQQAESSPKYSEKNSPNSSIQVQATTEELEEKLAGRSTPQQDSATNSIAGKERIPQSLTIAEFLKTEGQEAVIPQSGSSGSAQVIFRTRSGSNTESQASDNNKEEKPKTPTSPRIQLQDNPEQKSPQKEVGEQKTVEKPQTPTTVHRSSSQQSKEATQEENITQQASPNNSPRGIFASCLDPIRAAIAKCFGK